MTTKFVWVVRRDDPLDHEIDVFAGVDFALAQEYAYAVNGTATEEPILERDDEYVRMQLQGEEVK